MDTPNALVLPHFVLSDRHERDELFNEWDEEGVAKLGLEALDRHCVLLWPHFNNRLALERAFRAVTSDGGGGGGGDFVTRKTFRLLLKSVVFFNQRWAQFEDIQGTSGDCRLDRSEFTHALLLLDLGLAEHGAQLAFDTLLSRGGAAALQSGLVDIDTLCCWVARRYVLDDESAVVCGEAAAMAAQSRVDDMFEGMCQQHGLTHAEVTALRKEEIHTVSDLSYLTADNLLELGVSDTASAGLLAWNGGGLKDRAPGAEH